MKVDIAGFKSDMSKAAALGVSEADKISKQMSKTAKVGETLSRTGAALTKGLIICNCIFDDAYAETERKDE